MVTMLDEETVVLEKLDLETPCDAKEDGEMCPRPAAWVYYWSCGCISLLCAKHHEEAQEVMAGVLNHFYCDDVHFRVMHVSRIEPLKGGAS